LGLGLFDDWSNNKNISEGAIIGGGRHPKPGELSLAHRGVLFLDELGYFPHRVIDTMRQPQTFTVTAAVYMTYMLYDFACTHVSKLPSIDLENEKALDETTSMVYSSPNGLPCSK